MQFEYKKPTDASYTINLPSTISQAIWDYPVASIGEKIGIRVYTEFVGNGSDITIHICNKSGVWIDEVKGKVNVNKFKGTYTIPNKAKDMIYFEAELKKHNLNCKSDELKIISPIKITNAKWSKTEARKDDILKLTADIDGVPDGMEALVEIYEYDADGTHDFITKFPAFVEHKMVEAEWEYKYYGDTDDIPTAEETKKGYNLPEYFFQVKIGKVYGKSGLLKFKS